MTHNHKSLFVLLATLFAGPQFSFAQDPAISSKKQQCTPSGQCVAIEKAKPTTATQVLEANPIQRAGKKPKRKKSSNPAGLANQVDPKIVAKIQQGKEARPIPETSATATTQAFGPPKLPNWPCPRPYGLFTPTYCLEKTRRPDNTGATTPQAVLRPSATKQADPRSDSLLADSAPSSAIAAEEETDVKSPSREELFGLTDSAVPETRESRHIQWQGFVQNETAYTYSDPAHWSRAVVRNQLRAQADEGQFKWKATVRLDVDPVYYGSNFYSQDVHQDQRLNFLLRETYIDTSVGGFDLRLGKQNIIWGEVVGLFFADVVSATDQRDFILPDFEIMRIPQWAVRAERFGENYHAEFIWLPYPDINNIGKPGAEFFPLPNSPPPGFNQQFANEVHPAHSLNSSNYGARISTMRNGWDMSAFYYRSTDVNPTFYREVALSPAPTLIFTPRHDRIWQAGGTVAQAFGSVVFKAEAVYAAGRSFNVARLTEPTGVVRQDTLDYILGLDFALPKETRLDLQFFERVYFNHDPDLFADRREDGVSLLLSGKIGASLEPEFMIIQSVNRNDSLVRPKLGWIVEKNLRVTFGLDIFTGPVTGLFGRFNDRDRAYVQTRIDF